MTASSIVPAKLASPLRPSQSRVHTARNPQRPPSLPKTDRKTSIVKHVPSDSYGSEWTGIGRLIDHVKKLATGQRVVSVEKNPDRGLKSLEITFENGEWLKIEPLWSRRSDGCHALKGITMITSEMMSKWRPHRPWPLGPRGAS